MAALFWLNIFVCIYNSYGLKERINNEFTQIKCLHNDDPRFQLFYPHSSDCAKYFLCSGGISHPQVCPMGLHFSYDLQMCDYPEKVGCDREKVLEQSYTVECPSEDGAKPTHLPHPSDCGKFYICHVGNAHLKSCFPGLHFNAKLQVCDYPNRAGCVQSTEPQEKIIEDEILGCLTQKYGKYLIPSPHNCSEFIVCENGRIYTESCSSGLHFNVHIKACDQPDNAKCSKSKQMPATTSKQEGPGVPSPLCPTADKKDPIFFNNPSNCSEYFMCSHALAYKFACPARLHFSVKKKACDYEWLAGCQEVDGSERKS